MSDCFGDRTLFEVLSGNQNKIDALTSAWMEGLRYLTCSPPEAAHPTEGGVEEL